MKTLTFRIFGLLSLATCVSSQTLLEAISPFSELSSFVALLTENPDLAGGLLTSKSASLPGQSTILIPDNSAFTRISTLYNVSMESLSAEQLDPYVRYHMLVGEVTSQRLATPEGITVPTWLTGSTYNNRSAGEELGYYWGQGDLNSGQVVYLQAKRSGGTGSRRQRFMVRQLPEPTVDVQGGLGIRLNLTAVDGVWDKGYFQIVNKFLSLPLNCTDTVRRWGMTAFRQSLDRTGLGRPLDVTQNVTCLVPNDEAFLNAGSLNVTASIEELEKVLKFHIITQPCYSNFLEDGQTFTSFSNQTLQVTIKDDDIFVNDAKVINKNIITNNGVMYVIDRVMSPATGRETNASSSPTTSNTNRPGSSSTSVSTGLAPEPSKSVTNNTLSTGAKAGIGVGASLGVIGLITAAILFWQARRRRQPSNGSEETRLGTSANKAELADEALPRTHGRSELVQPRPPVEMDATGQARKVELVGSDVQVPELENGASKTVATEKSSGE